MQPKDIVLEFLSLAGQPLEVRDLIRVCGVLQIEAGSVRVALARLKKAGLVQSAGRGLYETTEASRSLWAQVSRWRVMDDAVVAWGGGWIGVHTGGLSRSDRKALGVRQRALRMVGFSPLRPRFELRPDNLSGGVAALRSRLGALGLEASAPVFEVSGLDEATQSAALSLWDGEALDESYRVWIERLEEAGERLPGLPLEQAARDAFHLGREAIRAIIFDPLLPEAIVDTASRSALVAAMRRFDGVGRHFWSQIIEGIS